MKYEFKEYSLLDVYDVTNGLTKSKKDFGFGYPFLTFKEVFSTYFLPNELLSLANASEKERIKCSIKYGDVFITRTSETIDELALTSVSLKDYPEATFNGFTKRLRTNKSIDINPIYASFYFKSQIFRNQVKAFATMTTRASLNNEMLARLTIALPDIQVQNKIAYTLKTLHDKIELNRKMNETLEAMAQALFKSWFVDFDPVIAKAKAKSEQELEVAASALGISKEILDLFPSEFEESEMGMIPLGWKVKAFGDIVTPKKGKNITKKTVIEGNVPVVAGGLSPAYFHNQSNVNAPVITVSASGANAGYVHLYNVNIWASDCSYINATNSNYVYTHYVYLKFKQNKITWMQQGAAQPHIYPSHLMRLDFIDCGGNLWSYFEDMITPMFQKIASNEREIQSLQKTRDTLLPKLLSGELNVSEVNI